MPQFIPHHSSYNYTTNNPFWHSHLTRQHTKTSKTYGQSTYMHNMANSTRETRTPDYGGFFEGRDSPSPSSSKEASPASSDRAIRPIVPYECSPNWIPTSNDLRFGSPEGQVSPSPPSRASHSTASHEPIPDRNTSNNYQYPHECWLELQAAVSSKRASPSPANTTVRSSSQRDHSSDAFPANAAPLRPTKQRWREPQPVPAHKHSPYLSTAPISRSTPLPHLTSPNDREWLLPKASNQALCAPCPAFRSPSLTPRNSHDESNGLPDGDSIEQPQPTRNHPYSHSTDMVSPNPSLPHLFRCPPRGHIFSNATTPAVSHSSSLPMLTRCRSRDDCGHLTKCNSLNQHQPEDEPYSLPATPSPPPKDGVSAESSWEMLPAAASSTDAHFGSSAVERSEAFTALPNEDWHLHEYQTTSRTNANEKSKAAIVKKHLCNFAGKMCSAMKGGAHAWKSRRPKEQLNEKKSSSDSQAALKSATGTGSTVKPLTEKPNNTENSSLNAQNTTIKLIEKSSPTGRLVPCDQIDFAAAAQPAATKTPFKTPSYAPRISPTEAFFRDKTKTNADIIYQTPGSISPKTIPPRQQQSQ